MPIATREAEIVWEGPFASGRDAVGRKWRARPAAGHVGIPNRAARRQDKPRGADREQLSRVVDWAPKKNQAATLWSSPAFVDTLSTEAGELHKSRVHLGQHAEPKASEDLEPSSDHNQPTNTHPAPEVRGVPPFRRTRVVRL